jgi:hypothetical protein
MALGCTVVSTITVARLCRFTTPADIAALMLSSSSHSQPSSPWPATIIVSGGLLSLVRVTVQGQSLEGEPVQLERSSLALPVLAPSAWDALTDDELVTRRLVELAAADALTRMHAAAARNEWAAAMLQAMKGIAEGRSRERMMKEAMYSSGKLRSRLVAKDESLLFSVAEESLSVPAYLLRKSSQGKGDV